MIHSGNWEDEIDVDGFVIMNKSQMKYLTNFLRKFENQVSISFGFGNSVDYENGKDILEEMSFQEITNDEHQAIKKFFGDSNDFGDNLILSIRESAIEKGVDFKLYLNNEIP